MLPDWEIWLDNHISPIIAKWLKEKFDLNVKSAYILQTRAVSDYELYYKAKEAGNIIIISKDSDIEEIINEHGAPPKLIDLRFGNCDNQVLFAILSKQIEKALRLLTDFNQDIVHIEL
jgi:predicted nuclease of predicted toxin-antitoxin system